jgi:putative nucleotidyltransferase with HDIG domain
MPVAPSSYRRRLKRGASIEAPTGFLGRLVDQLVRSETIFRLSMCGLASLVLLVVLQGWRPPLSLRPGMVESYGVVSRVPFEMPDPERTREAEERAKSLVRVVYSQDKAPTVRVRDGLKNRVAEIASEETLTTQSHDAWTDFVAADADLLPYLPPSPGTEKPPASEAPVAPAPPAEQPPTIQPEVADAAEPTETPSAAASDVVEIPTELAERVAAAKAAYVEFRRQVDTNDKLLTFEKAVERAFADIENTGILDKMQHGIDEGSQTEIDVHPIGNPQEMVREQVATVLVGEAKLRLKRRLIEELGEGSFTESLFAYIEPNLKGTLEIDRESTDRAKQEAKDKTPEQFIRYSTGEVLIEAGVPITADDMPLLKEEHRAFIEQADVQQFIGRAAAIYGLFLAMIALAGFYLHLHHPDMLEDLGHVATLLGLTMLTIVACLIGSVEGWHAEIVPLLLFAMIVAIAYDEDVALLLAAEAALIVVVGLGLGLADYVTLTAASAATVFWMGRIRSRSKLIYVGLWAGVVAFATHIGASLLEDRPLDGQLFYEAARTGGWTVLTGFLMTGLLPFIERSFGVLTDLSLLEVGDVAHPLLQELVRRAPGTYNHSINVASIAEAAAESIGARGLLVRVGAYFHDIGKMLKPAYFIENQGPQGNRHESLVPAMSTLIIVAHVKEGAELARQYNLPKPIVDLIMEHHGTTLVEYFYHRASEQSLSDPSKPGVDEQTYRYPGPKPSTRESAVMMLADAVESASRSLTEPTPARIKSLVHDLAMKRLLDGQFDECGLTLEELKEIERSLVKSLNAVYHGRVKYPDQRTAS